MNLFYLLADMSNLDICNGLAMVWTIFGYMTILFILLSMSCIFVSMRSEDELMFERVRAFVRKSHPFLGIVAFLSSVSFCVLDFMRFRFLSFVSILAFISLIVTVIVSLVYLARSKNAIMRRIHVVLSTVTALLLIIHELEPIWT